jgi:hypothetical protein
MGLFRDTASIQLAGSTSPIPASLNLLSPIQASSFSIQNGIATIVLSSALPSNGFNGPNFAIGTPAGAGEQVILYGFSTATYFNGKKVTVLSNNGTNSFSFAFTHTNVGSTSDSGYAAPCLFEHYRAVRIEVDQSNESDFVYVGDLNVSSTEYVAALSVSGQLAVEISSENIDACGIWMVSTSSSDKAHCSLVY